MNRCKTAGEIHTQWDRVYELIMRLGYHRAKVAHPETGGHPLYIHNWGKPEARQAVARAARRAEQARSVFQRLYKLCAHVEHLHDAGNYLWCEHCKKVVTR